MHGKKVCRCAIVSAATVRTGVSNGLHLVHVKVVNDGIKTGVEVVQQIHHLEGGAAPSNLCEPNNVTGRGERGGRGEERYHAWIYTCTVNLSVPEVNGDTIK